MRGSELGLSDIRGRLETAQLALSCGRTCVRGGDCVIPCTPRGQQSQQSCASRQRQTRQGSGGSHPSCRRKQVSVTVRLQKAREHPGGPLHLVIEDLGLARLGLGDEGVVEHVENILADLLELLLDLLSVLADGANVLL